MLLISIKGLEGIAYSGKMVRLPKLPEETDCKQKFAKPLGLWVAGTISLFSLFAFDCVACSIVADSLLDAFDGVMASKNEFDTFIMAACNDVPRSPSLRSVV